MNMNVRGFIDRWQVRSAILGTLLLAALPSVAWSQASTSMVEVNGGKLDVLVEGSGPTVLMIPSYGRGRQDFDQLAGRLVASGYRVIRPEPRGVNGSTNSKPDFGLPDMADDVAAVLRWAGGEPSVVLGHAYGQRVARSVATRHPELVRSLIMVAAGGKFAAKDEIRNAVRECFNQSLSDADHMAMVKLAFFAPGNDPSPWRGGWYPAAAKLQASGMAPGSAKDWWAAGGKIPILLLQGKQDVAALPENARAFKAEFPDRVTLIEIDHMGHAAFPEQPDAIAKHIEAFLGL
ncbi:alpha/beta fold hydrolase [Pseudomonas mediterranea]|uniref:alpha/beta fold hydrolase n=1 Tax=Pseudomonas mediterranea TaxID=183795 RepID=UPI003BF51FE0